MKAVTKDRILRAIAKADDYRKEQFERDGHLVKTMCTAGFRAYAAQVQGKPVPSCEYDRVRLELEFHDIPVDLMSQMAILDRFAGTSARRGDYRDRIHAIQRQYEISGAVLSRYHLGEYTYPCWDQHKDLALIYADLDLFRESKWLMFSNWLDYVVRNGLDLYTMRLGDKGWGRCSVEIIRAALSVYDWARIWETKHYTSPTIMKTQGWDTCRAVPKHPDDQLKHHVHFFLGTGLYLDTPKDQVWFCACNDVPNL
jgi:hypothetical protein